MYVWTHEYSTSTTELADWVVSYTSEAASLACIYYRAQLPGAGPWDTWPQDAAFP
jgi:hypothetical protein